MKVVICEKPSQAKDIAKGLSLMGHGKVKYSKTFHNVGDYYLFWAQGHLLKVDNNKTKESVKDFPYFPKKFLYIPSNKWAAVLLKTMKPYLQKADEIIVATDFGREGELIARLILQYLKANPKAKYLRLWTSATLTPKVVKEAFQKLKPLKEFDSLYEEAKARQIADWLVGINLSIQLMRLINDGQSWSVGRVQTPTLAIIVKRELEILNFKPQDYYIIEAEFETKGYKYYAKLLKKNIDEEIDEEDLTLIEQEKSQKELKKYGLSEKLKNKVLNDLKHVNYCVIDSVQKKTITERPHKLHTLTSLQTKINQRYKIRIEKIAQAAQWLYDNHYISYPRTESHFLSTENYDLVLEVLKKLNRKDLIKKVDIKNKYVFNDKKVTDHHALIPFAEPKEFPSNIEKIVFEEIKNTFLAQFYPLAKEEKLTIITKVSTSAQDYYFFTQETRTLDLGWKILFNQKEKSKTFGSIEKNDKAKLLKLVDKKKTTRPPSRYTEGSLINVMKNAHLLIPKDQKELREIMKKKDNPGLGTAATRTPIIKNLEKKGYTVVNKNFIHPTEKAMKLIEKLYGKSILSDPVMTAEFEQKLRLINQNKIKKEDFLKEVKKLVIEEINKFKNELKINELSNINKIKCPICGNDSCRIVKTGVFCDNGCKWIISRKFMNKQLNDEQIKKLLKGQTINIYGLKSKNNKTFNAKLKYDIEEKRIKIEKFLNKTKRKK